MKIYWSWKSVPELRDLPPRERERLMDEAREIIFSGKVFVSLIASWLGTTFGIVAICVAFAGWFPNFGVPFHILITGVVMYLGLRLGKIVVDHLDYRRCRPVLRELREWDYGEDWSNGPPSD